MADTLNKQKLQLRSVVSVNGDKNPPPATKLLINHGKPNFTIQRSTSKASQNDSDSASRPMSPEENNNVIVNNNYNKNDNYNPYRSANVNGKPYTNGNSELIIKSTKFNGVFKPVNVVASAQQNNNSDNEAAQVVLRRTARAAEPAAAGESEDDSVPEFIRRQRRIQERLAKENVLDFENRRSGYFTHVMISPTSASRTSFAETMSSPAVVPSLEMSPPSQSPKQQEQLEEKLETQTNGHAIEEVEKQTHEEIHAEAHEQAHEEKHEQTHEVKHEQIHEEKHEQTHEVKHEQIHEVKHEQIHEENHEQIHDEKQEQNHEHNHEQAEEQNHEQTQSLTHEHSHEQTKLEEEAEVANAIEEVNKAVAGEEDAADEPLVTAVAVTTSSEQDDLVIHHKETVTISHTNGGSVNEHQTQQHASGALCINASNAQPYEDKAKIVKVEHEATPLQNGINIISIDAQEPETHASGALCINLPEVKNDATTTQQHSSGALVVNHEASEPVSFENMTKSVPANEDATKSEHSNGTPVSSIESVQHVSGAMVTNHEDKLKETKADEELQAMAQLKFDIKVEDAQNIEVTPILRTD